MFDFDLGEYADVIWVNELDPDLIPDLDQYEGCKLGTPSNETEPECILKGKDNYSATYHSPTDLGVNNTFKKVNMSAKYWPTVAHIHGMEVRPNFDGNPLSWISNNEDTPSAGVGYMNLSNECYYDNFQNSDNNSTPY